MTFFLLTMTHYEACLYPDILKSKESLKAVRTGKVLGYHFCTVHRIPLSAAFKNLIDLKKPEF